MWRRRRRHCGCGCRELCGWAVTLIVIAGLLALLVRCRWCLRTDCGRVVGWLFAFLAQPRNGRVLRWDLRESRRRLDGLALMRLNLLVVLRLCWKEVLCGILLYLVLFVLVRKHDVWMWKTQCARPSSMAYGRPLRRVRSRCVRLQCVSREGCRH